MGLEAQVLSQKHKESYASSASFWKLRSFA